MTAVQAHDLHPGDVLDINDWGLHVTVVVEPERDTVGVAVAEFDFLLHFPAQQLLNVERP